MASVIVIGAKGAEGGSGLVFRTAGTGRILIFPSPALIMPLQAMGNASSRTTFQHGVKSFIFQTGAVGEVNHADAAQF